jgi:hypothetical protein
VQPQSRRQLVNGLVGWILDVEPEGLAGFDELCDQ